MNETLHIGELARRSGRSVHAIRWYDAQGLMPGVMRDGGGRRLFSPRHVEWLALLERLRNTGMSIAELRAYTALVRQGRSSLARQREALAAHRERVAATLVAWQAALELIDAKLGFYTQWIATGERPATEMLTSKGLAAAKTAERKSMRRRQAKLGRPPG